MSLNDELAKEVHLNTLGDCESRISGESSKLPPTGIKVDRGPSHGHTNKALVWRFSVPRGRTHHGSNLGERETCARAKEIIAMSPEFFPTDTLDKEDDGAAVQN